MNSKPAAIALVSLALGAAAGYFAGSGPEEAKTETQEVGRTPKPIGDVGASASVKALRARVAELERLLAEKSSEAEKPREEKMAEAPRPMERGGSPSEWMKHLQKTDPARYTQITNRIASWRRRRAETARSKMEFLSSIDTSRMSAAARKVHEELQELVARREEIESQIHQEGISDDERHRLFEEMRQTGRRMNELNSKERDNLLAETARNLGFEGEDVKEVVSTVKEVVEATESGWGHGRGRWRPPHGAPR